MELMIANVLVPVAIFGALVGLVVLLIERGGRRTELSTRNLLQLYLYLGSLAGLIVLVIGLAAALTFALATAFGSDFAYASPTTNQVVAVGPIKCPPDGRPCVTPPPEAFEESLRQARLQQDRQRQEDLIRGLTFTAVGLLFWGAHAYGRRTLLDGADRGSTFRRAYLMVGAMMFGLATLVLLPQGIYQALSRAIVTPSQFEFRPPAGEPLAAGLVVLPFWLFFLFMLTREFRAGNTRPSAAATA